MTDMVRMLRSEGEMTGRPVIINAMNLGRYIDGIGTYTFNLVRGLAMSRGGLRFIIYVNRTAKGHLAGLTFPDHCTVRWVTDLVSPDHGFSGHLFRLILSNWIGLRNYRSLVFSTSQLEAIFFRQNQIITIHDVIPLLFRECHRKQYFYFRRLLPMVLRRARVVITPSRHTKGLLEQVYQLPSDRIRVIYNGVRLAAPASKAITRGESESFILYTGRIVRMKNITGILRAFGLIQHRIPHRLMITGHGRERMIREFDESKLTEYGIPVGRVCFKGHLSFEEVARLLRTADVLVFPSFYEGFGLPPLEAMAAGCPAVVSHTGSLPETCGDAVCYVDPYDVENIANGIQRVLSDRALRDALVSRGLERAKRFTWDRSAHQHLSLFSELNRAESTAVVSTHQVPLSHPATNLQIL